MSKVLLHVDTIAKTFYSKNLTIHALNGVTLDLYAGEVFGLLGVNGAGKTTLSSIIATLIPPTGGDITRNGKSIYDDVLAYRKILGFCPQKPNFEESLTVREILEFAGLFYGKSAHEVAQRVDELLAEFDLKKYAYAKPTILSGGYKQRLLIARALVHNPRLVILDEPTVGLDPHIRHQLWDVIRQLKAMDVTVLLTTHYMDEAEELSDRICILDAGNIMAIDTPDNLKQLSDESTLEKVFLSLIKVQHDA